MDEMMSLLYLTSCNPIASRKGKRATHGDVTIEGSQEGDRSQLPDSAGRRLLILLSYGREALATVIEQPRTSLSALGERTFDLKAERLVNDDESSCSH